MRGRAARPSPAQLALSTASGPTRAAHRWYLQRCSARGGRHGQLLDARERILEAHACLTGGGAWWVQLTVRGGRRWSVWVEIRLRSTYRMNH